jgi:hypothetical protein
MAKKKQGWQRGEGPYSGGMGKDPIRPDRSIDKAGNPVGRTRQLDHDVLLDQALASRLPKNAK